MNNTKGYLETWSNEFEVTSSRIRQLIGDRHWPTDGRHKEAILKNFLNRMLPSQFKAENGFVISHQEGHEISREIDIIIYDTSSFVPFKENGVIICYPESVRGWIHVKTRFNRKELQDVSDINKTLKSLTYQSTPHPFSGSFFFENTKSKNIKWLYSGNIDYESLPDSICINGHSNFFKSPSSRSTIKQLKHAKTNSLAVAAFIADMLDTILKTHSIPKFTQEILAIGVETKTHEVH